MANNKLSLIFEKIKGFFYSSTLITKSRKFENFICRYFKDSGEFDLLKRPNDIVKGIKSEEDNLPDCRLRDKRSNKVFWVECKWRPVWNEKNGVRITYFNTKNINFYKNVQNESKYRIFIGLGVGIYNETKTDLNPEELYFFPLDMFANRNYIRKSYLIKNNRKHKFKYKKPKFFVDSNDLR